MGDICNTNDLERFLRSPEGKVHLEETRNVLVGRTIVDVLFTNEVHYIATVLRLDNGDTFVVFQPSLDVEAIREQFKDILEREYLVDYPEQKLPDADSR